MKSIANSCPVREDPVNQAIKLLTKYDVKLVVEEVKNMKTKYSRDCCRKRVHQRRIIFFTIKCAINCH